MCWWTGLRQMSRAIGTERLYAAFYERHPDGTALLAQVPDLFDCMELDVTPEQVEAVTAPRRAVNLF